MGKGKGGQEDMTPKLELLFSCIYGKKYDKRFLTIEEASAHFRVSKTKLRRYLRSGDPIVIHGIRYTMDWVDAE